MAPHVQTLYFLVLALAIYTVLSIIGVFAISASIQNRWLRLSLRLLGCALILFLGFSIVITGFGA